MSTRVLAIEAAMDEESAMCDVLGVHALLASYVRNDNMMLILSYLSLPFSMKEVVQLSKYRPEKLRRVFHQRLFSQRMFPTEQRLYFVCTVVNDHDMVQHNWAITEEKYGRMHDCRSCADYKGYGNLHDFEYDNKPALIVKRIRETSNLDAYRIMHPILNELTPVEMVQLYERNQDVLNLAPSTTLNLAPDPILPSACY